jgi:hypothetical protein
MSLILNSLVKIAGSLLVQKYPHLEEAFSAFLHFIKGSGKSREIPDSLIEELTAACRNRLLKEQEIEVGDKFIVDYTDYKWYKEANYRRDDEGCHLLHMSPLQLVVGGFTIQILNLQDFLVEIYMEDTYDWHSSATIIPTRFNYLVDKLPKSFVELLKIEKTGGVYTINQMYLSQIGKEFIHYKQFNLNLKDVQVQVQLEQKRPRRKKLKEIERRDEDFEDEIEKEYNYSEDYFEYDEE